MKIAYWSPIHGQAGTTSNILATTLITGMQYKKSCLLTQTHFNFNNLEAPLVGSNSKNSKSREYFLDVGVDSLLRCFKASKLDRETIDNCCIELPNTNISLLPGTAKSNRDSFDFEMERVMMNLLKSTELFREVVFIDVSSGDNQLSMDISDDSDLTVVNLSQNMNIVETYFTRYKERMKGKIFYLFGNYDANSKYNINNIRRMYHKDITSDNSGVIPYNTLYLDAQCDGRVVDFISNNLVKSKNDDVSYFMMKSINATGKILKLAGIDA